MALTMRTMPPVRWRLMTAVQDVDSGISTAMRLLEVQGGHPKDLSWLALAGLTRTRTGGTDVMVEDLVPPGLLTLTVTLTGTARRLLATDPDWLVCRVLQPSTLCGSGQSVARIRTASGADEGLLREMEAAGLLEAYSAATLEPEATDSCHASRRSAITSRRSPKC